MSRLLLSQRNFAFAMLAGLSTVILLSFQNCGAPPKFEAMTNGEDGNGLKNCAGGLQVPSNLDCPLQGPNPRLDPIVTNGLNATIGFGQSTCTGNGIDTTNSRKVTITLNSNYPASKLSCERRVNDVLLDLAGFNGNDAYICGLPSQTIAVDLDKDGSSPAGTATLTNSESNGIAVMSFDNLSPATYELRVKSFGIFNGQPFQLANPIAVKFVVPSDCNSGSGGANMLAIRGVHSSNDTIEPREPDYDTSNDDMLEGVRSSGGSPDVVLRVQPLMTTTQARVGIAGPFTIAQIADVMANPGNNWPMQCDQSAPLPAEMVAGAPNDRDFRLPNCNNLQDGRYYVAYIWGMNSNGTPRDPGLFAFSYRAGGGSVTPVNLRILGMFRPPEDNSPDGLISGANTDPSIELNDGVELMGFENFDVTIYQLLIPQGTTGAVNPEMLASFQRVIACEKQMLPLTNPAGGIHHSLKIQPCSLQYGSFYIALVKGRKANGDMQSSNEFGFAVEPSTSTPPVISNVLGVYRPGFDNNPTDNFLENTTQQPWFRVRNNTVPAEMPIVEIVRMMPAGPQSICSPRLSVYREYTGSRSEFDLIVPALNGVECTLQYNTSYRAIFTDPSRTKGPMEYDFSVRQAGDVPTFTVDGVHKILAATNAIIDASPDNLLENSNTDPWLRVTFNPAANYSMRVTVVGPLENNGGIVCPEAELLPRAVTGQMSKRDYATDGCTLENNKNYIAILKSVNGLSISRPVSYPFSVTNPFSPIADYRVRGVIKNMVDSTEDQYLDGSDRGPMVVIDKKKGMVSYSVRVLQPGSTLALANCQRILNISPASAEGTNTVDLGEPCVLVPGTQYPLEVITYDTNGRVISKTADSVNSVTSRFDALTPSPFQLADVLGVISRKRDNSFVYDSEVNNVLQGTNKNPWLRVQRWDGTIAIRITQKQGAVEDKLICAERNVTALVPAYPPMTTVAFPKGDYPVDTPECPLIDGQTYYAVLRAVSGNTKYEEIKYTFTVNAKDESSSSSFWIAGVGANGNAADLLNDSVVTCTKTPCQMNAALNNLSVLQAVLGVTINKLAVSVEKNFSGTWSKVCPDEDYDSMSPLYVSKCNLTDGPHRLSVTAKLSNGVMIAATNSPYEFTVSGTGSMNPRFKTLGVLNPPLDNTPNNVLILPSAPAQGPFKIHVEVVSGHVTESLTNIRLSNGSFSPAPGCSGLSQMISGPVVAGSNIYEINVPAGCTLPMTNGNNFHLDAKLKFFGFNVGNGLYEQDGALNGVRTFSVEYQRIPIALTFSANSLTLAEGQNGSMEIRLDRASSVALDVRLSLSGALRFNPPDGNSGSDLRFLIDGVYKDVVRIPAGATSKSFTIHTEADPNLEPTETSTLRMASVTAVTPPTIIEDYTATAQASITLTQPVSTFPIRFLFSGVRQANVDCIEGESFNQTIGYTGVPHFVSFTVNLGFEGNGTHPLSADDVQIPSSVTLYPGQMSTTFPVSCRSDSVFEANETGRIKITSIQASGLNFTPVYDFTAATGGTDAQASLTVNEVNQLTGLSIGGIAYGRDTIFDNQIRDLAPAGTPYQIRVTTPTRATHLLLSHSCNSGGSSNTAAIVQSPGATYDYGLVMPLNASSTGCYLFVTAQARNESGQILQSVQANMPFTINPFPVYKLNYSHSIINIDEGTTANVTVTLRNSSNQNVSLPASVDFWVTRTLITAGPEDVTFGGYVTLPANATSFNIPITAVADTNNSEGLETFIVKVTNANPSDVNGITFDFSAQTNGNIVNIMSCAQGFVWNQSMNRCVSARMNQACTGRFYTHRVEGNPEFRDGHCGQTGNYRGVGVNEGRWQWDGGACEYHSRTTYSSSPSGTPIQTCAGTCQCFLNNMPGKYNADDECILNVSQRPENIQNNILYWTAFYNGEYINLEYYLFGTTLDGRTRIPNPGRLQICPQDEHYIGTGY